MLAAGILLVFASSAGAATFSVDNTGDTSAQACTGAASDCSLRSAVELSNASPATTDAIDFDSSVFNGGVGSTISVGSQIVIGDTVTITGGDCDPTAGAKPCVGVDNTAGSISLIANDTGIAVSGIAFTGASTALQALVNGLSVTGSWFGVGLDGTTLDANDTGITFLNAGAATIGGDTVAERNVFANSSTSGISGANAGNLTIQGNYFGALPSGASVGSPGTTGILLLGSSNAAQIGGDAATTGLCDGECNLIVNHSGDGISFQAAPTTPTAAVIKGNFIGLGLDGTSDRGNGGEGLDIGDSNGTTIGGPAATERNYIAGNVGGIRAVGAPGASGLTIENNAIGTSVDTATAIPNPTGTPGSAIWTGASGNTIDNNRIGGGGVRIGSMTIVRANTIGVGPTGQDLGLTNEPGLQIDGNGNTIGTTGAFPENTIGNVHTSPHAAIFLTGGATGNVIIGNEIGTTSTGIPAPNAAAGIELGGSNSLDNNQIGGLIAGEENVISNSATDAIVQAQAGDGNRYQGNLGRNNGSAAGDLFIDVAANGFGNPISTGFFNDDIQAPSGVTATSTLIEGPAGSARAGATIVVYATYTNRGDVRAILGQTTAFGDGSWNLSIGPFPDGQCVTAGQTDTAGNGSELAPPVTIGGGSCVVPPITSIDSGPANGSSTANPTPSFGFSSEAGATFQCSVDGGAFTACSSPFTTSALAPGAHSFRVRALNTVDSSLGQDVGAPVTRSFTVLDTTAPEGAIDKVKVKGSTAKVTFSATDESAVTFMCKLDKRQFRPCTSPKKFKNLDEGKHKVQIQATDAAGNVDATPAKKKFRV